MQTPPLNVGDGRSNPSPPRLSTRAEQRSDGALSLPTLKRCCSDAERGAPSHVLPRIILGMGRARSRTGSPLAAEWLARATGRAATRTHWQ
eukprot:2917201-Rhodomonas_salina.3